MFIYSIMSLGRAETKNRLLKNIIKSYISDIKSCFTNTCCCKRKEDEELLY